MRFIEFFCIHNFEWGQSVKQSVALLLQYEDVKTCAIQSQVIHLILDSDAHALIINTHTNNKLHEQYREVSA